MNYRIEMLAPANLMADPFVPRCYGDLRHGECLMIGAWDASNTEKYVSMDDVLGLAVITPSIMDPDTAFVKLLKANTAENREQITDALLKWVRRAMKAENKKNLLIWTLNVEGHDINMVSLKQLQDLGYTEVEHSMNIGAWGLGEVYDTEFLAKDAAALELDPHLESFHSFSRVKCMQLLRRLGAADTPEIISPTIESPLSRVYMDGKTPLAACMVEKPGDELVVVNDAYLANGKGYVDVFRTVMGGSLGAALEGEGLNTLLIARFHEKNHLRELEEQLGASEVDVEQRLFLCQLQ